MKSSVSPTAIVVDHAVLPPQLVELAETLPPAMRPMIYELPPRLVAVLEKSPVYVDRRTGANITSQHVTPVSHRTLEAWPVPWWRVNGKATTLLMVLLAVAYSKLSAAPMIMGGRRRSSKGQAETESATA
jgi:hypothetical protein